MAQFAGAGECRGLTVACSRPSFRSLPLAIIGRLMQGVRHLFPMNLVSMLKLVFSEDSFLRAELDHVEVKRKAGEAYQPAEEFRPEALARIKAKRRNLLKSALWPIFLVVAGALVATGVNASWPLTWALVRIMRAGSVVLITWAVWSKLGDIKTYRGETLLELTSQHLYKFSYSAGIFVGSISLFLEGSDGA